MMGDPILFFRRHQYALLSRLNVGRIKDSIEEEQLLSKDELELLLQQGKKADRSDISFLLDILKQKEALHLFRFLRILDKAGYEDFVLKVESTNGAQSDECTQTSVRRFLVKAKGKVADKLDVENLIERSGKLQQIKEGIGAISAFPCANRKVVVCGPAGHGKTVLIAQTVSCAWLQEEYFADGVIWKTVNKRVSTEDIMRSIVHLARKTDPEVNALVGAPLQLAAMSVAKSRKLLIVVDDVDDDSFLSSFADIPVIMLFSTQNSSFGKYATEGILRVDVSKCTDDEAKEIIMKCSDWSDIPENALRFAVGACDCIPRRLAKLGEAFGRFKASHTPSGLAFARDQERVILDMLEPIIQSEEEEEEALKVPRKEECNTKITQTATVTAITDVQEATTLESQTGMKVRDEDPQFTYDLFVRMSSVMTLDEESGKDKMTASTVADKMKQVTRFPKSQEMVDQSTFSKIPSDIDRRSRETIRYYRPQLNYHMRHSVSKIADELFRKKHLNEEQYDQLASKSRLTDIDKARYLLDLLERDSQPKFDAFLDALQSTGHGFLAYKLQKYDETTDWSRLYSFTQYRLFEGGVPLFHNMTHRQEKPETETPESIFDEMVKDKDKEADEKKQAKAEEEEVLQLDSDDDEIRHTDL